jgi:ribosomal protein L37AE/L43A/transposase-like protein
MEEDYPRSLEEFEARFRTDATCIEYMLKLRWPEGFRCPHCGGSNAWQTRRSLWHCRRCGAQTAVTAGTIFHASRKPLPLWFRAMWHITSQKYGANALGLQRVLDLGSYETAWQWLHKLRRAMVRPGRDQLSGCVQVDETYIGGRKKPGKRGRGAAGKAIVAMAVEDRGDDGIGRIRLEHIPDVSSDSLSGFVGTMVATGSAVKTDDWSGYLGLPALGYRRWIMTPEALVLPHLVASLLKRWLLGTYQGAVKPTHLAYYLDEFTFRFNRRTSRSRGKLFYRLVQQALLVEPIPEKKLKAVIPAADDEDFDDLEAWDGEHNI